MSKRKLLICMPDLPFPARKNGISIRYQPIIEFASQLFDIHLIIISDHDISSDDIREAKQFCKKTSILVRKKNNIPLHKKAFHRIKSLIPGNTPFFYLCYDEFEIIYFLTQETEGKTYDVALSVLVTYDQLIKRIVTANRYTLDVIDSPYATSTRNSNRSLLKLYDDWLIKLWERRAINSSDYSCYISPLDRVMGAGSCVDDSKIGIIPNGIYVSDLSNKSEKWDDHTIGYLGHMGYRPNVLAALRLYRIFKKIQSQLGNTKLVIIGRDPAPEIIELKKDSAVIVTGTVDNIWPFINGTDIFVFPMEIGSGQQNKLLESMSAGKAVISTSLGNSGIGAKHNSDIVIADKDDDIGREIIQLLKNKSKRDLIGSNGKTFVLQNYYWNNIFEKINSTLLL